MAVVRIVGAGGGALLGYNVALVGEAPVQVGALAGLAHHFEALLEFGAHGSLAVFAVAAG